MPRIPGEDSLGGLPSMRSGRAIAVLDETAIGRGIANMGAGISSLGVGIKAAAEKRDRERQSTEAFNSEQRFQEFRFAEAQAYDEAVRGVEPGQADHFAERYTQGYQERAKAFLATIPEKDKQGIDQRLFEVERSLFSNGLEFERGEIQRTTSEGIEDTFNNAILPRVAAARTAADLDAIIADGNKVIDAAPGLTAIQRDEAKRAARERVERAFDKSRPAEERARWLGTDSGSVADRIIQIESGGNPNARPRNADGSLASSAYGPGQFTVGTWYQMLRKYRPELVAGKGPKDVADLRSDPALAREMTEAYAAENARYLGARGHAATPGNVYLAHFLGPAGAAAVLGADPSTPVERVLDAGQIAANRSVLAGKTAGDVAAWAAAKMDGARAGRGERILSSIPYEDRVALASDADAQIVREQAARLAAERAANGQRINTLEVAIGDGAAGMADILAARRDGWLTDAEDINRLTKAYTDRNKDAILAANVEARLRAGETLNPFASDDSKGIDALYRLSGGADGLFDDGESGQEAQARLRGIVAGTDIVPSSAVVALRGGIWSADPKRMAQAFALADGLYRESPSAVRRALTDEDLRRVSLYQDMASAGVRAEVIAERLDPNLSPQEAKRREEMRTEGLKIAGDYVSPDGLAAVLDSNGGWPGGGADLPDGLARAQMDADLVTNFSVAYSITGNAESAKKLAYQWTTHEKWGVSTVTGDATLMAWPPERHYPVVDGNQDYLHDQLIERIENDVGDDYDPDSIQLVSTATTEGNLRGEPPYTIVFARKSTGVIETIPDVGFSSETARQDAADRLLDSIKYGPAIEPQSEDRQPSTLEEQNIPRGGDDRGYKPFPAPGSLQEEVMRQHPNMKFEDVMRMPEGQLRELLPPSFDERWGE